LIQSNVDAFDWSCSSFLAFGCLNKVIVIDTNSSLKVSQTLIKHKYSVNRVQWVPNNELILLSTDVKDNIIIWDVVNVSPFCFITNASKDIKSLKDLAWVYKGNLLNALCYTLLWSS